MLIKIYENIDKDTVLTCDNIYIIDNGFNVEF